ncbi:MAG: hypothetical protein GDA48_05120 [Hormoscilla sp. GM102CHS1]|nr:hypothetical protein [Hormoscilla sp. GM102CHS1]
MDFTDGTDSIYLGSLSFQDVTIGSLQGSTVIKAKTHTGEIILHGIDSTLINAEDFTDIGRIW